MSENERIIQLLEEICEGAREGKNWRNNAQKQLADNGKNLAVLSSQLDELERIINLRFENGTSRFSGIDARLLALEGAARGGGDVIVTSGNQTVGAEPAASATKPGLLKPAATLGGGGFFGWLVGGGWEQILTSIKKWPG